MRNEPGFAVEPLLTTEVPRRASRLYPFVSRLFSSRPDPRSPRNCGDNIWWLTHALVAHDVRLSLTRISSESVEAAKLTWRIRSMPGESADHMLMKHAAFMWMRACGARDAEIEYRCDPYRYDCYSEDADWIVEVGNTPIGKLRDAILSGAQTRFTLIPFQAAAMDSLAGRVVSLRAIEFVWTVAFAELEQAELEARQIAAAEHMADLDRRARNRRIEEAQRAKRMRVSTPASSPTTDQGMRP